MTSTTKQMVKGGKRVARKTLDKVETEVMAAGSLRRWGAKKLTGLLRIASSRASRRLGRRASAEWRRAL
ncbi:MAG: hypothetical protein IPP20_03515 [Gemmatimonadetes bacterium]|nr:hypothetical protein [Gemmatimonadota bacterium]